MEPVPTVPCHQAASCPMLLWFFPRKLVKAISGETKTVISVHRRHGRFLNRGRAVRKSTQASAKPEKARAPAAAGAQMQRARDHCADFLHCLAVIFFLLGI